MPTPRIHPDRTLTGAERQRRHKEARRQRKDAEVDRLLAALKAIRDGYPDKHRSKQARDIAAGALSAAQSD